MADIDSDLIGKVFQSVPYSEILGAPIKAAMDAAIKQSREVADFILKIGFETDKESGIKKAVNVSFEHSTTRSDGQFRKRNNHNAPDCHDTPSQYATF